MQWMKREGNEIIGVKFNEKNRKVSNNFSI